MEDFWRKAKYKENGQLSTIKLNDLGTISLVYNEMGEIDKINSPQESELNEIWYPFVYHAK